LSTLDERSAYTEVSFIGGSDSLLAARVLPVQFPVVKTLAEIVIRSGYPLGVGEVTFVTIFNILFGSFSRRNRCLDSSREDDLFTLAGILFLKSSGNFRGLEFVFGPVSASAKRS